MNFEQCIKAGKSKRVAVNTIRASSIFDSSIQAVDTAKGIPLTDKSAKTIFRELYEGLRENCEAMGFIYGYKFLDHESVTFFLRDILKEPTISGKFDRYRKLRNGINYYGEDIELETVKEAVRDIPILIKELEKHKKSQKF